MGNEIKLYISRWGMRGGAPGLALYRFDTETGAIRLDRMLDESRSFDFSRIDREKNILYLCNETNLKDETGYDTGRIYGFRIDPETGGLTELFRKETYCPFPDYIGFSADGTYAVVPHHSWATGITTIEQDETGEYRPVVRFMDSAIDLFEVNADGTFGRLVDVVKHRFDGIQKDYQGNVTIPHPHCAVRAPSGDLFAVCDKGDCHLFMYKIENGRLVQLSRTMTDAPLSEPRYCAFHPTKPWLFVNHEHSATGRMMVSAFAYDEDGNLTLINKADCLPPEFSGKAEGQGFCINRDGTRLYNQLADYNAMAVLDIDQETGAVSLRQRIPIEGIRPRGFLLSPDEKFLISVCLSGPIAVYRVEPDGSLTATEHTDFLHGAAYLSFCE